MAWPHAQCSHDKLLIHCNFDQDKADNVDGGMIYLVFRQSLSNNQLTYCNQSSIWALLGQVTVQVVTVSTSLKKNLMIATLF